MRTFLIPSLLPTLRNMSTLPSTKHQLHLEITSDSVCPFCYVGYRRVLAAISRAKAQHLPIDFTISFAPFQLDPTLPLTPGENKRARYVARYGGEIKVAEMEKAMIERGKIEGINFSYGGNISQTVDSHRLIEKARLLKGQQGQLKIVDQFFAAYFENEQDIGSHDVLATGAEQAGIMTKSEALAFLATSELLPEVKPGFVKAQQRGISGVPFTILNGKLAISGAQETETFLEVFEKIGRGELKV